MTYTDQIAAIVAEITPILKDGFDAEAYAAGLLDAAEDDDNYFEVRGLHTKTGAPHAFRL